MKILHLTKKYPEALGGDAVVVSNLQKRQEAAGHSVVILTSNCKEIKDGQNIYKFGLADTPEGLDQITVRRLISLAGLFLASFRVLARERPDVIHAHSVDMAFMASFAARWFKIPMVQTFHIVTFYDQTQPALRRKTELLLAKAAGLRAVTAPNAYDVSALKNAGLSQAVLLPNGVDLHFWRRNPKAKKGPVTTFISFGRLESQKGHEYLIKAAASLHHTSAQPFKVIIAGEGSQKQYLLKLARQRGVEDLIKFVGRKTPKQIQTLLSETDIAVFPSLYETTPITLLEAWAVGIPVIATNVGILRSVPENTRLAFMTDPGDEWSLAKAMQQCMADRARLQELAAAGHEEVKKYAWPGIADRAENLYRRVL